MLIIIIITTNMIAHSMKKIAFLGSSNTIKKDGYANIIKNIIGNNCKIYGLGTSSILISIFSILNNKIINEFDYVIMQFNPTDSIELETFCGNKFYIISYLLYIIKAFQNSKSVPIFINLPYSYNDNRNIATSIIRTITKIFDVPFIDLCQDFKFIRNDILCPDTFHYSRFFSEYIANRVLKFLQTQPRFSNNTPINIDFYIFNPVEIYNSLQCKKGTRLFQSQIYVIKAGEKLYLPSNSYLCGLLYWRDAHCANLGFQNEYIKLFKNLAYMAGNDYFLCRSIGYSVQKGLKGGYISADINENGLSETTFSCLPDPSIMENYTLNIASILLCNRPPIEAGMEFYMSNICQFEKSDEKLRIDILERQDIAIIPFMHFFDELLDNGAYIFKSILQMRPDLNQYIHGKDYPAESLLIWSWQFGVNDIPILNTYKEEIFQAIKFLAHKPHFSKWQNTYSRLIHVIWTLREDLKIYDPQTLNGREELIQWFANNGRMEYNLKDI